jgi:hypothetical protein
MRGAIEWVLSCVEAAFFVMGITTASVKLLDILDDFVIVSSVSLNRWQHCQ